MGQQDAFMRSIMFVPGSKQKMIDKALGLTALDVALFDIEDGVAPAEKPVARTQIREMLSRPRTAPTPARFVRVNAVGSGADRIDADLEVVIVPGLEALVVPKVETADELRSVVTVLDRSERALGLGPGSIKLMAAIESARGLLNAPGIAACSERVVALLFGGEDYALDLGLPADREGEARELVYARSAFANAAASAHVAAIDGVWPDIHDAEGVRRDAVQGRRLGMTGKSTFHPGQIEIINDVFTPTEGEVDRARRIVAAFEDAQARGEGAVAFGGQLLDLPIVERARRTLHLHEALAERAAP